MEQEDRALLRVPPAGRERRGQLQVWPLWAGPQRDTKASQVLIWGLRMDFAQQVGKFTDVETVSSGDGRYWELIASDAVYLF